jgi:hypothetical protein
MLLLESYGLVMDGCILTGPIIPKWKNSSIFSLSQPYPRAKDNISRSTSCTGILYQAPPAGIQHETHNSLPPPPPPPLHRWYMPRPRSFSSNCAFQYSIKPTHPGNSIIQRNLQEIQYQYYSSRGMLRRWVLLAAWVGGIFILSACCLRCW